MPSIKLDPAFVRDQMQMVPQQFDPEVVEGIQNQSQHRCHIYLIFYLRKIKVYQLRFCDLIYPSKT